MSDLFQKAFDNPLLLEQRREVELGDVEAALAAYHEEFDRWGTRSNAGARNGLGTAEWIAAQRAATYDLLRRKSPPSDPLGDFEVVATGLADACGVAELFRVRELSAVRAALMALGLTIPPIEVRR